MLGSRPVGAGFKRGRGSPPRWRAARTFPIVIALIACAFVAPALILSCSSRALPPEDIGLAQLALGVGGTCTTDASCSTNAACWVLDADGGHKECHCVPGYVVCGTTCVDIGASATDCG
jgi:hypothetical protein